jgi:hypothetical protein
VGVDMGMVIGFPEHGRAVREGRLITRPESATVIILPVIRIERYTDEPSDVAASPNQRRRRRRRASRDKTSA